MARDEPTLLAGREMNAGDWLQLNGVMLAATGNFFAERTRINQLESNALSLDFERSMSHVNARNAEREAALAMEAGEEEIGQLGMRYAAEKAARRVSVAASGTQAGVGSNAEVAASVALSQRLDQRTIDINRVRAAGAARMRAVEFRNRGLIASASARNVRATARSINPYLSAASTLLSGAGSI